MKSESLRIAAVALALMAAGPVLAQETEAEDAVEDAATATEEGVDDAATATTEAAEDAVTITEEASDTTVTTADTAVATQGDDFDLGWLGLLGLLGLRGRRHDVLTTTVHPTGTTTRR